MYSIQQLLEMVTSDKASVRYDACEWLRVSQESSPEIIYALQKASHDPDVDVASRAAYALQADVHHRQAVQMGLIAPDERDQPSPPAPAISKTQADILSMLKEIRSWGIWSLMWGAVSIFASGIFSSPWGILLIIVGLSSFVFKSAAMFVIYGVTLAWAALHNFGGLNFYWIIIALVQVYITVRVFLSFRRYHQADQEIYSPPAGELTKDHPNNRAARFFPWSGAILGSLSFIVVVGGLLVVFLIAAATGETGNVPSYLYFLIDLMINLGVLAFALGLASLLSHYRPKILGILAVGSGGLTLLIDLAFIVLNIAT